MCSVLKVLEARVKTNLGLVCFVAFQAVTNLIESFAKDQAGKVLH